MQDKFDRHLESRASSPDSFLSSDTFTNEDSETMSTQKLTGRSGLDLSTQFSHEILNERNTEDITPLHKGKSVLTK